MFSVLLPPTDGTIEDPEDETQNGSEAGNGSQNSGNTSGDNDEVGDGGADLDKD